MLSNFPFPLYYFTRFTIVEVCWVGHTSPLAGHNAAQKERSRATDSIVVSTEESVDSVVLFLNQVLAKHASRVRELKLDVAHFEISTLVALFGDRQKFDLRLDSLEFISSNVSISRPYSKFPTGVVEADCLRRLEVHSCGGPWYTTSLQQALTTLRLYNIDSRPSLIEFLELLRGLTSLQVLDMVDSLPFCGTLATTLIIST